MAEALGTLASVLQLVDTVLKAREYFKDFHEAPKEQKKLFSEMEGLKALLVELDKRAVGNPSSEALSQMVEPLEAFETTLELVTKKLGPVDGLSKLTKKLNWTLWSKKEAAGYLEEFERIKALINLWLTMDIWDVGQKQISNQDSILNTVQEQKDIIDAEKRQKILDWMSPLNFFQRQADVFGALQSGTGEWLLSNTVFQDWESGSGKVLFCRGIPGAGKTVLASLVVNHLEAQARNSDIGLACIYLNHKETESQTITNLLGALAAQLMLGKHIPPLVHSLYEHHLARRTRPNIDEFHKALDLAVALYPKVYFIVDALDEYPENYRHRFLKYLGTLGPKVNIMMTSRPHINLDSQLPNLKTIEIRATEDDIHKYVDAQIQNSARLSKHIHTRPELCNEIQAKIGDNAKGMFLLAKLHIESLATKNTIKAVREALQHLPKDLQHTYDEAMERINHQTEEDRQLGILALTWVSNAKRLLSVAELREALAIEPGSTFLDVDNLLDMDIILAACAGLIIVDEAVSVIRLIHYTTQDYLDSIQSQHFPLAHTMIVSTCLTYLSFPEFEVIPEDWEQQDNMLVTHPFLKYAQYCLMHAKGEPEDSLQDQLMAFLTGASRFTSVWDDTVPWKWVYNNHYFPPLCLSAASDMEVTVRQLLAQGIAPEDMIAALCAASSNGHIHLVQLLIDAGTKINAQDNYYGDPLAAASQNGHDPVVQLLIENGADVNAQGGFYGNALQAASQNAHKSVVRLLIEKGADVNAQGGFIGNALQAASMNGHESVVKLLIEKGADVEAQGGFFGNALQAVSLNGHESVVQLLIEKGADVNAQGGDYGNALQAASRNGNEAVVRLLIEKGADVNAQGEGYENALQAASMFRHESVVKLLIEKGADVNAQGGFYGNALQAASWNGHESVVQLLIEKGADVNAQGGYHGNSLQAASEEGHESVVRLLIEKGADVNAQGGYYGNALEAASWNDDESVVQLLIDHGAKASVLQ
ncbi:ankyrin repeat domain-containing protein [Mycena latifolia]|nr:ankyrin repeat domain-containing protein [Mycena latifolia]